MVDRRQFLSFVGASLVLTPVVAPDKLPEYRPDVVVLANPIYRDEVGHILAGLGQEAEIVCV